MSLRRGFIGAVLATVAVVAAAFLCGRFPISLADLAALLMGQPVHADVRAVVVELRAPRILGALVVGAGLAAAGSAYQAMFRNPLVSPDILGVSSGAALGASIAIFLSKSALFIQLGAFAGGVAAVGLVYAIATRLRNHEPLLALVLTGVVIGTLFGSMIALIKVLADPQNQLPVLTFWLLGSLSGVSLADLEVAAPLIVGGLVPLILLRWRIDALGLPEDEARALGVHTGRLRTVVIASATLITAAIVAISGIIGWVGLLVPHAARLMAGPAFRRLLPLAMLLGGAFLVAVDTLCRSLSEIEIPPGVLTALVGTPAFLWLFASARRSW
jgi:iron complex transport system permease protein